MFQSNNDSKFMKFFIVSGLGWLIDMSVYTILIFNEFGVFTSNLISASIAVTYVYIMSVSKIFSHDRSYIKSKYIIYIGYQLFSIIFFAYLIYETNIFLLEHFIEKITAVYSPLTAKIIITPINLITNFIFMKILIEKINIRGIYER